MTYSHAAVRAYWRIHGELDARVNAKGRAVNASDPDPMSPQVRADMAIRAIEDAVITLHEIGPYWIDYQRAARASGDLREIALTAMRARA